MADRPTPLGTLLSTAGRRLATELDTALAEAGFADVRSAHAPLFMTIDPQGSSVTELAERAHMTKQAMGELVRHLQRQGYVDTTTDERDRRVRRVALTRRGWRALQLGAAVVDSFESWLTDQVGTRTLATMRRVLGEIITNDSAAWQLR